MNLNRSALAVFTLLLTAGCNTIGPKAVRTARIPYNVAIADSQDEEFLANLLRVKDGKHLLFLTLNQVSTNYAFTSSATLGLAEASDSDTLDLGLSWEEDPTATYSPLSGKEFSQRLLSPITLENLALLYRAGFDGEWIIKLCVTQLGALEDDEADFDEVAALVGQLQQTGDLLMSVSEVTKDKSSSIETGVHIRSNPKDASGAKKLLTMLGLESGSSNASDDSSFKLQARSPHEDTKKKKSSDEDTSTQTGTASSKTTNLAINTRSLMGAMRLAVTEKAKGGKGWLSLETHKHRPKRAERYVAAVHDGKWYSISRNDDDGKEIFLILSYLYTMQAGEPTINPAPALVIPVG